MSRLTAETITDAQLRAVRALAPVVAHFALNALDAVTRDYYRARCAEILNAAKAQP